jgi:hypothetical protein
MTFRFNNRNPLSLPRYDQEIHCRETLEYKELIADAAA